MAIHHKELPPSLHVEELNPNIDWAASPFQVNTELRPWDPPADGVRTAGVSAFGFGGTNFHAVLEEYVPGRLPTNGQKVVAVGATLAETSPAATVAESAAGVTKKPPLRGALVLGAGDETTLVAGLRAVHAEAVAGRRTDTRRAARSRPARRRACGHRLRRRRRAGRQGRAGAGRLRAPGAVEGAPRPWHLPRQRASAEGRLPLHRAGLAVRQHAGGAARRRAGRRPDIRRGRRGDGAADRPPSHVVPVRRPRRRRRRRRGRGRAAQDGDHPAGRAVGRPRHHQAARHLRHRARSRDGPQPGRVRRPGRGRRTDVPGRAGGRQRSRVARWPTSPWTTTGRWLPCSRRWRRSRKSSPRPTATSSSPTSTPVPKR